MSDFKPYLVSYRHDGSEWNIEMMARSHSDAQERLGKLVFGRVEGAIALKVPDVVAPLAPFITWLCNLFGRR